MWPKRNSPEFPVYAQLTHSCSNGRCLSHLQFLPAESFITCNLLLVQHVVTDVNLNETKMIEVTLAGKVMNTYKEFSDPLSFLTLIIHITVSGYL